MIGLIFGIMLLLIFLGMDIAFAMGLSALAYISVTQIFGRPLPFTLIPQKFMEGVDSFALVAIPLFILAGGLINRGGITKKLVDFANSIVGHLRGGLGLTCIVVNMITAGMSGSAIADASSIGSILIPAMKEEKYKPSFSAALVASGSTIGPIIPPSIPMIMIGAITGVSVGRLFLGGAIPGFVMGFALMVYTYIYAVKSGFARKDKPNLKKIIESTKGALIPLGIPVIILGAIVTGIATPTEAAVIAVWYSFIVITLVYKSVKLKDVYQVIIDSMTSAAGVLFTVAAGVIFGWVATVEQLGPKLTDLFFSISSSHIVILFLLNVLLLLMGMVMSTIPIILMMTPILFPLIQQIGLDPVHFGVVMCLNLMLGLLTPPIGFNLFITSAIAKVSVEEVVKDVLPFLLVLLMVLGLITYIPQIVLWLPNLVMK